MSNSVAEAYLLIVRESNVPIFGEAVPKPFTGQIELDSWSWEIKNRNADTRKKDALDAKTEEKSPGRGDPKAPLGSKENPLPFKPDGLIRQVADLQIKSGLGQPERDKKVQELIKKRDSGRRTPPKPTRMTRPPRQMKRPQVREKGTDLATTPPPLCTGREGDLIPQGHPGADRSTAPRTPRSRSPSR